MEKKFRFVFSVQVCLFCVLFFAVFFSFDSVWDLCRQTGFLSDFKEVCRFSLSDNPFTEYKTSYAPLVMILFLPFAKIAGITSDSNELALSSSRYIISVFLFYSLCLIIISILTYCLLKEKKYCVYVLLGSFFSAPFVFAFIRGNIIFMSLIFALLFWLFKDSDNRVLREISLISLALSGVIKIYPLFLGIYLINRKRVSETIRVAIYCILLILIPFLFFEGGFDNIKIYIENVLRFSYLENREYGFENISLSSILCKVLSFIDMPKVNSVISTVLSVIVLTVSVIVGATTKSNVSLALIAVYTFCLIPPVSYFYCLTFLLIPLIETANSDSQEDGIYILYMFVMTLLPFSLLYIFMYHSIFLIVGLTYEFFVHNKREKEETGGFYESSNICGRIRDKDK